MSDEEVREDYREFIIEGGTNEMAPHRWQSFFTIEKHGDSCGKSEFFFLEPTFKDPEEAINTALVQVRRTIDKKLSTSAQKEVSSRE